MFSRFRFAFVVLALALGIARPSAALFNTTSLGLPTGSLVGTGGTTTPPPPPPPLPPITISRFGNDWMEVSVRPPAGRTSQLLKRPPDGAYAPFQTLVAGRDAVIRDAALRVGKQYCYRMQITGGGLPDETWTRCATTDWRVGFEQLAVTPAESARALRLFDWRDTQPLAAGSADAPALYYMNLLIEPGDPLAEQAFRTMGLHVQSTPLFPVELNVWTDGATIATDCGLAPVATSTLSLAVATTATRTTSTSSTAGALPEACKTAGRWSFAVVPGSVFNELRSRMLEQIAAGQTPGVRALVFRKVPVAAALPVGVSRHVLDIGYLGAQGFEFNAIPSCVVVDGVRYCQVRQEILGWLTRKVVKWVVELGDEAVQAVRGAIGRIERLVRGEVQLDVQFRVLNTDAAFGVDQVMRSGWSGSELALAGVEVEVRQGLGMFRGKTDANGHVRLTVAKNVATKVCVQLENDTAELTEFLIEKKVCLQEIGSLSGDRSVAIDVRDDYVNALLGMTDARAWLRDVVGMTMPKITVLVGSQADQLAAAGESFAPCMGRMPGLLGLGADVVGALGSILHPAFLLTTTAIEFEFSVDIVLRTNDDGSRGVPVHEYGHTVMCEMLQRQGLDAFQFAWTDVILQTATQGPDDESSWINEGFADFIAAQVVGGTNYFAAPNSTFASALHYCDAGAACLEENGRDTTTFEGQVRRVTTMLLDAFDGPTSAAGDGSHWDTTAAPFLSAVANDSNRNDEAVELPAADLLTLFSYWDARGWLLREDDFFGALADLAQDRGYASSQVCGLFSIHDPATACPSFVARVSQPGGTTSPTGTVAGTTAVFQPVATTTTTTTLSTSVRR
ncbi:MAG: hypothetical protein DCC71_01600 [Proteobacteria bacterium]|nr:MAG: hypothetical protein DCC71_01600 [Pseudomonadota bacterium]